MTVHKAKGLEFPVVFVIGLSKDLCPAVKGNLEEERRICFVAISRAMRMLFISYPLNYLGQPAKKSQFLDEMLGNHQSTNQNLPLKTQQNRLSTRSQFHPYPNHNRRKRRSPRGVSADSF